MSAGASRPKTKIRFFASMRQAAPPKRHCSGYAPRMIDQAQTVDAKIILDPTQAPDKWQSTLGNARWRYSTYEVRSGNLLCELYAAGLGRSEIAYFLILGKAPHEARVLLGFDRGAAAEGRSPLEAASHAVDLAQAWILEHLSA